MAAQFLETLRKELENEVDVYTVARKEYNIPVVKSMSKERVIDEILAVEYRNAFR